MERNESIEMIHQLFEKYQTDEYMLGRMHQYICQRLPKIFESFKSARLSNQSHEEQMQSCQDSFIQSFLRTNQYFYVHASEKFFYYDNTHYHILSEDDILHNVLTSISKNRQLHAWKKSTKVHVMCKIKNTNLFKSIPNSDTIQYVLDLLLPTLFSTKTETKYFLTILGDAIFKKNTSLIHFIIPEAKSFLRELNNISNMYVGVNLIQTFKHKYHEHGYQQSRLCKISKNVNNENIWRPIIENNFIDIMCVAAHYSIRYSCSDEYLLNACSDDVLTNYVFYLKEHETPDKVVKTFLQEYVESTNRKDENISWKNMLYLWKHFLDKQQMPTVIFQQNFKQSVIRTLSNSYNETTDCFYGISSKYMPSVESFIKFWTASAIACETETDLEIEEIMTVFKRWRLENGYTINNMNERQLFYLITYYFPEVQTEDNKYIHRISLRQWDKKTDIEVALEALRTIQLTESMTDISFYEAYDFYCKNQRTNRAMIVSKQYFEKFISENMEEYIIDDAYISSEWIFS